jgi:hypothetical protein
VDELGSEGTEFPREAAEIWMV